MNNQQQQQPGQDGQPFFSTQRVYLKDLSLEQLNSPHIFLEQERPSVEVQVDVVASQLTEGVFEVTVIGTVATRVQERVAPLVEVKQANIFDIHNVPAGQVDSSPGITCSTIVCPYLHSNIADTIGRAGFQPIHLAEINLQALYEQRLAAAMEQQSQADDTGLVMPDGSRTVHQV